MFIRLSSTHRNQNFTEMFQSFVWNIDAQIPDWWGCQTPRRAWRWRWWWLLWESCGQLELLDPETFSCKHLQTFSIQKRIYLQCLNQWGRKKVKMLLNMTTDVQKPPGVWAQPLQILSSLFQLIVWSILTNKEKLQRFWPPVCVLQYLTCEKRLMKAEYFTF